MNSSTSSQQPTIVPCSSNIIDGCSKDEQQRQNISMPAQTRCCRCSAYFSDIENLKGSGVATCQRCIVRCIKNSNKAVRYYCVCCHQKRSFVTFSRVEISKGPHGMTCQNCVLMKKKEYCIRKSNEFKNNHINVGGYPTGGSEVKDFDRRRVSTGTIGIPLAASSSPITSQTSSSPRKYNTTTTTTTTTNKNNNSMIGRDDYGRQRRASTSDYDNTAYQHWQNTQKQGYDNYLQQQQQQQLLYNNYLQQQQQIQQQNQQLYHEYDNYYFQQQQTQQQQQQQWTQRQQQRVRSNRGRGGGGGRMATSSYPTYGFVNGDGGDGDGGWED